jgi:hypothetical protein
MMSPTTQNSVRSSREVLESVFSGNEKSKERDEAFERSYAHSRFGDLQRVLNEGNAGAISEAVLLFLKYYFERRPPVDKDLLISLVFGPSSSVKSSKVRSLLDGAGQIKKPWAAVSLHLLRRMLDTTSHDEEKATFLLTAVTPEGCRKMALDKHILAKQGNHADAYRLVFILTRFRPDLTMEDVLPDFKARKEYFAWYEADIPFPSWVGSEPCQWIPDVDNMEENSRMSTEREGEENAIDHKTAEIMGQSTDQTKDRLMQKLRECERGRATAEVEVQKLQKQLITREQELKDANETLSNLQSSRKIAQANLDELQDLRIQLAEKDKQMKLMTLTLQARSPERGAMSREASTSSMQSIDAQPIAVSQIQKAKSGGEHAEAISAETKLVEQLQKRCQLAEEQCRKWKEECGQLRNGQVQRKASPVRPVQGNGTTPQNDDLSEMLERIDALERELARSEITIQKLKTQNDQLNSGDERTEKKLSRQSLDREQRQVFVDHLASFTAEPPIDNWMQSLQMTLSPQEMQDLQSMVAQKHRHSEVINKKAAECEMWKQDAMEARAELVKRGQLLDENMLRRAEVENQLLENSSEAEELAARNMELLNALQTAKTWNDEREEVVTSLMDEVQALEKQVRDLRSEISKLKGTLGEQKSRLTTNRSEFMQTKEELQKATLENESLRRHLNISQGDEHSRSKESNKTQSEIASLRYQVAQMTQEAQKQREIASRLQAWQRFHAKTPSGSPVALSGAPFPDTGEGAIQSAPTTPTSSRSALGALTDPYADWLERTVSTFFVLQVQRRPASSDFMEELGANLERMVWWNCDDPMVDLLAGVYGNAFKKLRFLAVADSPRLTDRALASLCDVKGLTFLDLSGCNIQGAGLRVLREYPRLQGLMLPSTVQSTGVEFLKPMHDLTVLSLPCPSIEDSSLAVLANMSQLERLDLNGAQITNMALIHLRNTGNLLYLDLSWTGISDVGLKMLDACPKLNILKLRHTEITNEAGKVFASMKHLKSLDLCATKVTNALKECFEPRLPQLEELTVEETSISDAFFVGAAQMLPSLQSLSAAYTQLTDAGVKEIALCPHLEVLVLTGTKITDAGMLSLSDAPELRMLYLASTIISEVGASSLGACRRLDYVDLSFSRVPLSSAPGLLPNVASVILRGSPSKVNEHAPKRILA